MLVDLNLGRPCANMIGNICIKDETYGTKMSDGLPVQINVLLIGNLLYMYEGSYAKNSYFMLFMLEG